MITFALGIGTQSGSASAAHARDSGCRTSSDRTSSESRNRISSPERIVFALANVGHAPPGNLADQRLGQRLIVANLEEILGGVVLLQFLSERIQARGHRRETEMRFVRGKCEQESGLDEERAAPFDLLLGLRRDALQYLVQLRQVRLPFGRRRLDVL